jgi:hypothetical protein
MTKQKLLKELSHTLWDSDLLVSRVTLALAEFSWAVMLLWPGDSFSRKIYKAMSSVASEEFWGMLFLASACIQLYIVLSGTIHTKLACIFAGYNACFWITAAGSLVYSMTSPPHAALSGDIALACAAVWIWIRPYILKRGYTRAGY